MTKKNKIIGASIALLAIAYMSKTPAKKNPVIYVDSDEAPLADPEVLYDLEPIAGVYGKNWVNGL